MFIAGLTNSSLGNMTCPFRGVTVDEPREICLTIASCMVIVTNLVVVMSSGIILKNGHEPQATYLFLGNVALADLLTGLNKIILQFVHSYHYGCIITTGLVMSSSLSSAYSVGLIGIDRFFYILHGLHYQSLIFPSRARIFIGVSWLIGCTIGLLPVSGWNQQTQMEKCCFILNYACREYIVLFSIAQLVPIVTVLILYSIILCKALTRAQSTVIIMSSFRNPQNSTKLNTLKRHVNFTRNKADMFNVSRKKSAANKKWKAVKVVAFTSGSFFIALVPNLVSNLMFVFYCHGEISEVCNTFIKPAKNVAIIFVFINCLLNPVIYAWWHKGFRRFIKNRIRILKINNGIQLSTSSVETISTNLR